MTKAAWDMILVQLPFGGPESNVRQLIRENLAKAELGELRGLRDEIEDDCAGHFYIDLWHP